VRQQLAAWMAVLCLAVVTLLALQVARVLNPAEAVVAPVDQAPEPGAAERGRDVYDELRCATCHSIAGAGNPRYPLDGVSERLDRERIRAWIVGAGALADSLPPSALRRKRAGALADDELGALVEYLLRLPGR